MRVSIVAFVCLAALRIGAQLLPDIDAIASQAEGCVITPISSCDIEVTGRLTSGDCTLEDGQLVDYFEFVGVAGQLVEVTVRPVSSSYQSPFVVLVPPPGDGSRTPFTAGGKGAKIWYQLSSSGAWRIGVSSLSAASSGDYVLHFYCYSDDTPTAPQSCVAQELLCGQTGGWYLTSQSCRFSSAPNRLYAPWSIYGKQGDTIIAEMTSSAFAPLMGIYDENGDLLQSSFVSTGRATLSYFVSRDGWYHINTTSTMDGQGGSFQLQINCQSSGCLFPYLVTPVPNVITAYGQPATIPLNISAVGTTTAKLREDLTLISSTTGSSLTTPPIVRTHTYLVDLENVCGAWTSDVFTVSPDKLPRRRVVRK